MKRPVVMAILRAIMSAMDAAWGTLYPDRWRRWYDDGYKEGPIRYQCGDSPREGWHKHPDVVRIKSTWWNEVADRVAAAWDEALGGRHAG